MKKLMFIYNGKGLFGGKETPLEASIISCDKYEQCSYFKNNQCLKVRSFLSPGCKYGRVNNVKGYTSRAAKYHSFKRQWQEHERYSKLKYPPQKLGLIGDEIVFPYPYIRITQTEDGNVKLSDPGFGPNIAFIARKLHYRLNKTDMQFSSMRHYGWCNRRLSKQDSAFISCSFEEILQIYEDYARRW